MQYVRLGATGVEMPRLILGCGNFGGVGSAPAFFGMGETDAQAAALMDRAWEAGITAFDTADAYGGGRSETYIGRWIARKGSAVRDRLVLCTKVFNPVGADGANARGLSRKHMLQAIDASLTRLRTDRVDLYLTHDVDPATPIEETLGAFDDLIRAGKVLHIGASNIDAWRFADACGVSERRGWARFACVQNAYSLLDRSVERDVLPCCAHLGAGFTAFSPLAGGWLTGKYRAGETFPEGSRMTLRPEPYGHLTTDRVFRALDALGDMARGRGVAMSTLALAWVLHQPVVTAAIIGPRTPEHLDAAVASLDVALSDEEAGAIGSISVR
jgi:aryl-alcohol dehydrogenase-like predicted oxidoreductase